MTVVLLHGLGADRSQPLKLFGPVLDTSGQIIAPDVRAHGASPHVGPPGRFTLDALAEEIADELTTRLHADAGGTAPEPITLIGISMGAAIGVRIALRGLLPVRRAVFVRPAFGAVSLPPNLTAFPLIAQLVHDWGPDTGAAAFRSTAAYRTAREASPLGAAGLLTQFSAPDARARAMRLMEIPRNRAYRDTSELRGLAERGVQCLVVGAPRDPVHPIAVAEEWAAGLGCALERVPARDDGQAAQNASMRTIVGGWLAATS